MPNLFVQIPFSGLDSSQGKEIILKENILSEATLKFKARTSSMNGDTGKGFWMKTF